TLGSGEPSALARAVALGVAGAIVDVGLPELVAAAVGRGVGTFTTMTDPPVAAAELITTRWAASGERLTLRGRAPRAMEPRALSWTGWHALESLLGHTWSIVVRMRS